jgi:hypothetical protein
MTSSGRGTARPRSGPSSRLGPARSGRAGPSHHRGGVRCFQHGPSLFIGEIDRVGDGGRHQAGVRPDVSGAFPAGDFCRSSVSEMAQAALTSPMWLKAWGKLPKSSPLTGSTSSASRPTSLTTAAARAKTVRARAVCPARARAWASQTEGTCLLRPRGRRGSGSGTPGPDHQ